MDHYELPFNPASLFSDDGKIAMISEEASIAQHIMLLITTRRGENRCDPGYGNAVWDVEFENATSEMEWERIFSESLVSAIQMYEPRICNPEVAVRVSHIEQRYDNKKLVEIKKKAAVYIRALLADNREPFHFTTEIFLSPLSVD